jgi:hypothetical protein
MRCSRPLGAVLNLHVSGTQQRGYGKMLLVDVRQRRIESVRREQLLRPFVPLSGLRTIDDAGRFLCYFRHGDASLRDALVKETTRGTFGTSLGMMTDADLIAATAREIAAWRIQVGSLLPECPALIFDGQAPWGDSFADVVFPSLAAASTFVRSLRTESSAIAALDSAIAHEAAPASVRLGRGPRRAAETPGSERPWDEVAGLLAAGVLLLVPPGWMAFECRPPAFRLAWRRRAAGNSAAKDKRNTAQPAAPARLRFRASPPRSQPSPSLPIPATLRSILPKAPSSNSRQAETLIAAANSGIPLCEECARAAASA